MSAVPTSPTSLSLGRLTSLSQFLTGAVLNALCERFPAQSPYVQVSGYLGPFEARRIYGNGSRYGISLIEGTGDDQRVISIKLPQALIERKQLQEGQYVTVSGLISAKPSTKKHLTSFEFYIDVDDANVSTEAVVDTRSPTVYTGRLTIETLKILGAKRNAFPYKDRIVISVIHPISADANVYEDFARQIESFGALFELKRHPASMTSSAAIATAIEKADGDVLVVIRGGGKTEDFSHFDTYPVLKALAKKHAYRVLGIGHSKTATALDLICEHSDTTPSAAGTHIKEAAQQYLKATTECDRLRCECERLEQGTRNHEKLRQHLYWVIVISSAMSFILGLFLRR
jgi:hypothetical protein